MLANCLAAVPVRIFTTKADGSKRMEYTTMTSGTSYTTNAIKPNPAKTFQDMDGFGYAITYSACYNLLKMNPAHRREFLTRTFSRTEGYGVSYVRISIGCSDFSSTEYTLCDKEGLENFRLYTDETKYVIPILKEILAINPDLKIMAAPWTCPKWMKIKSLDNPVGYDSWTSGVLNPKHYETYAQYFVKFVQAFQAEGISIYAVTPQNEPLNRGNSASLYLPWNQEAELINRMAPAFHKAGIRTKIYCFDHNYNYDNISDQNDYPVKVFNALDKTMDGFDLVVGTAWHNYGGSSSEISDISGQLPQWENIFTETSIGTWNDGRNLSARLVSDTESLIMGTVNKGCRAVMMWNFVLDLNRGPNRSGGCTTCYGAVDIDQNDYHTLGYNSHYYLIAHASLAAQPGAVRIDATGSIADIAYSCFKNPDGTLGAVIINKASTQKAISFGADKSEVARFSIPGKSVVTVVIGENCPTAAPSWMGENCQATKTLGQYTTSIDARQGDAVRMDFVENPEEWDINPLLAPYFLPMDGKYQVDIDMCARKVQMLSSDTTIYISALANCLMNPYYYPIEKSEMTTTMAMFPIEPGLWAYPFTVGSDFNPQVVDFSFHQGGEMFSGKTGAARYLAYDRSQGISFFGFGKGSLGHADGHIYKMSANAKIDDGGKYIIYVDLREGYAAGKVYVKKYDPQEVETKIETLPANTLQEAEGNGIHDLTGRRMQNPPARGIYIKGNRKVVN